MASALPVFLTRIAVEERALRSAFPDYADYSVRVRRFLPLLW
jgi:protein-S-isoprenylcysteine O-methyltransferase Ste14